MLTIGAVKILDAVTTTGAGSAHSPNGPKRTFQCVGSTASGAGSAVVLVQVSNDNTNWSSMATITLALTTSASNDGFVSDAAWRYVRGNVSSISGTGATITLWMSTIT